MSFTLSWTIQILLEHQGQSWALLSDLTILIPTSYLIYLRNDLYSYRREIANAYPSNVFF